MVILTSLLIGKLLFAAGVGTAAVVVAANWNNIKDELYNIVQKIEKIWRELREYIPKGAVVVGDRIVGGLVQIAHKLYYQEKDEQGKLQWVEETTKMKVSEDKVPPHIRARAKNNNDITSEMEEELGMTIS